MESGVYIIIQRSSVALAAPVHLAEPTATQYSKKHKVGRNNLHHMGQSIPNHLLCLQTVVLSSRCLNWQ